MNFCCKLSFFLLTLLISLTLRAQYSNPYVAGIGGGTFVYQGDLVPSNIGGYKSLRPTLQLYAGKWVNPYFQVRLDFATGKIKASDADYTSPAWKQERNLKFQTSIHELTTRLVFSPLGNNTFMPDKHFFPYVFAGAGVSFVRVKRDWSGISDSMISSTKMSSALAADSAHKLPSALLSIPVGAGINVSISPTLSLFGEVSYHVPVTDYLDGFSNIANNARKDNYYQLSVGINYTFLKNRYTRCPRVVR